MVLINNAFAAELKEILAPEQIVFDAPMREHTTFKIGGPADCLLSPCRGRGYAEGCIPLRC